MSDTPEQTIQADDAQAQAGGIDASAELLNKIALLEANNKKLLNEKKNASASVEDLQRQISDLQNNQQKAKQSQLAEAGKFKTLWQDATTTVSSLQDEIAQLKVQLEEKDVAFQQQQIKASALNALSQSGVVNPDQAFSLLKDNLRLKDGVPIALAGGVEVPLQQHLESLGRLAAVGNITLLVAEHAEWVQPVLLHLQRPEVLGLDVPDGTDFKLEMENPDRASTAEGGGLIRQPLILKNHGRLRLRKKLGNFAQCRVFTSDFGSATRLATSGPFRRYPDRTDRRKLRDDSVRHDPD